MSDHAIQPTVDDMHPGVECCTSCLEDVDYDPIYSLYPLCCCEAVRWGWKSSYDWITQREVAVPPPNPANVAEDE